MEIENLSLKELVELHTGSLSKARDRGRSESRAAPNPYPFEPTCKSTRTEGSKPIVGQTNEGSIKTTNFKAYDVDRYVTEIYEKTETQRDDVTLLRQLQSGRAVFWARRKD